MEIDKATMILIDHMTPSRAATRLANYMYSMLRSDVHISNDEHEKYIYACKIDNTLYRPHMGIRLYDDESLAISIKDPDVTILSENIKVNIECDFWTQNSDQDDN
jgi:hypothetical protein